MARIKTYGLDTDIDPADKVIGSDGQPGPNFGNTKNYSMSTLASYFQGNTGQAGASAYDIWLSEGNTGTIQDFLNSLVGATGSQGPAGAAGANGTNGAQGVPGANGTSITIQGTQPTVGDLPASGSLGDLWIIDQTGGGATAGDGYVWTAENTWLNIGPLRGPQGIQGVAGTNGAAGGQGIQGEQGIQGIQGIQGEPGTDGTLFQEVTGITPKICNEAGAAYANIGYSVQECRMYKTAIQGSSNFLYTFSVKLVANGDAALEAVLTDTNNELAVKLDGFTASSDGFSNDFRKHAPNVGLIFETNNGVAGANMPGPAFGAYIGGSDVIRIHITRYDFVNNAAGSQFLDGNLIKTTTQSIEVLMNGTFVGLGV